jgi:hypothetical protein
MWVTCQCLIQAYDLVAAKVLETLSGDVIEERSRIGFDGYPLDPGGLCCKLFYPSINHGPVYVIPLFMVVQGYGQSYDDVTQSASLYDSKFLRQLNCSFSINYYIRI